MESPSDDLIALLRLFAPTRTARDDARRILAEAECLPAPSVLAPLDRQADSASFAVAALAAALPPLGRRSRCGSWYSTRMPGKITTSPGRLACGRRAASSALMANGRMSAMSLPYSPDRADLAASWLTAGEFPRRLARAQDRRTRGPRDPRCRPARDPDRTASPAPCACAPPLRKAPCRCGRRDDPSGARLRTRSAAPGRRDRRRRPAGRRRRRPCRPPPRRAARSR